MYKFQNYHRHSAYTNVRISDSIVSNEDYAKRAVELEHGIISSCEHGYQGRYIECHELANQYNLKFVFATEAYWVRNRCEQDGTNCHIFLAARNETGRQAINDVLSEANISGFYKQPRLDQKLILSLPPKDIIVTSACVAFWRYDDVDDFVVELQRHFKDNFFLEVQCHNTEKQAQLNRHILELHEQHKIPLIYGCDSHYIYADDAQKRTDYLYSKGLEYPDEEGWYMDYPDGDTVYDRFAKQSVLSHQQIIDSMDNTDVFLEVEKYDNPCFDTSIKMTTLYPDKTQEEKNQIYKHLVWEGWKKYRDQVSSEKHTLYIDEMKKEVDTVVKTGMADYFICNHAIVQRGKLNGGWLTKTGRGSCVSFFTNKLLGFTEVDRIQADVKMYPERFMSVERILETGSLPDIDFNVSPVEPFAKAQQEVLGEDHAYPMVAYGTLQKSAAWKLYAKSQLVPFETANEVSERLKRYDLAVKHTDDDEKDSIDIVKYIGQEHLSIFNQSKEYQGVISSWSIAPCSYLLYSGSIRKEIGLVRVKDHLCCLMDGKWAEKYHFLKNDLLKVSVVDLIYRSFKKLGREPLSVSELLKVCPKNDAAWDMYAKGFTVGLNQYERSGTSHKAMQYKPRNISESCAFVAAIRPAFQSMYHTFESRKPFDYGVKVFDDLIQTAAMPKSFVLYQEQEMAALHFAGIPMSECYSAIKNIAKKRAEKVLAYKDIFINGFTNSIAKEGKSDHDARKMAGQLWKIIEDSASYSFNASHSYCVAIDSLYCAWLKAHHPLEFYTTYLEVMDEKGDKHAMRACQKEAETAFKIRFPPYRFMQDNRSINYDAATNSIYNTLSAVKGFGDNVGESLYKVSQENFNGFLDVLFALDKLVVRESKIRPLIMIDYFEDFGNTAELNLILDCFTFLKRGTAKQIKKTAVDDFVAEHDLNYNRVQDIFGEYASGVTKAGKPSASWGIRDIRGLLDSLAQMVYEMHLPELNVYDRIAAQKEILGYINLKTGSADRWKLFIHETAPMKAKGTSTPWGYRITAQSIGTGIINQFTIRSQAYNACPVKESDIILTDSKNFSKNQKGYFTLLSYTKWGDT